MENDRPRGNLKMFCGSLEKYLVPGIGKGKTPTSDLEKNQKIIFLCT